MRVTDIHRVLGEEVLEFAKKRDVKIAAAESCTGGMLMTTLTDIPGSSAVVERGFITYSNAAKIEMLGVSKRLIDEYGAVSERVARAMAEGALRESRADLAIAITGVAGPGGSASKPEGMVCFGMAPDGEEIQTATVEFGPLGRDKVRAAAVHYALTMMRDLMA